MLCHIVLLGTLNISCHKFCHLVPVLSSGSSYSKCSCFLALFVSMCSIAYFIDHVLVLCLLCSVFSFAPCVMSAFTYLLTTSCVVKFHSVLS